MGGPVLLVVPEGALVDGRPRTVRGASGPVVEVAGCRGFRIGAGRTAQPRPREGTEPAAV
jgi:hypothetical protein